MAPTGFLPILSNPSHDKALQAVLRRESPVRLPVSAHAAKTSQPTASRRVFHRNGVAK